MVSKEKEIVELIKKNLDGLARFNGYIKKEEVLKIINKFNIEEHIKAKIIKRIKKI